ncbi:unnamed protein product [Merluccius merluccius]
MDAEAAAPLSPINAGGGGSPLWRLGERRVRKPATANIFGGVALWQLQKLFRAAGDQDAEQRAQLVWGHGGGSGGGGEAQLAQALIGLRARGRRRGLRVDKREGHMGSRWLKAFHHMSGGGGGGSNTTTNDNNNNNGSDENSASDTETLCGRDPRTRAAASHAPPRSQGLAVTSGEGQSGAGPGPRRRPGGRQERYLHRIIH